MNRLAVIWAVILIVVSAVVGCQSDTSLPTPAPAPTPPRLPNPPPTLELTASTDRDVYLPGEPVNIALSLINAKSVPIVVSPHPPEMEMRLPREEEGKVVKTIPAGSGEIELGPGEDVTYSLVWDQRDSDGQQVEPGYYNLNIHVNDIRVNGNGIGGVGAVAEMLIQFLQGAMERTIEFNQPQTVNGMTITLERIEMTAKAVKFYVFTVPPDYSPPESQDISPHDVPYLEDIRQVHAAYSVDGITKDAGSARFRIMGDGIGLEWAHPYVPLDPVPSDATELIFTIPRFGDWEGPWEFYIALE